MYSCPVLLTVREEHFNLYWPTIYPKAGSAILYSDLKVASLVHSWNPRFYVYLIVFCLWKTVIYIMQWTLIDVNISFFLLTIWNTLACICDYLNNVWLKMHDCIISMAWIVQSGSSSLLWAVKLRIRKYLLRDVITNNEDYNDEIALNCR